MPDSSAQKTATETTTELLVIPDIGDFSGVSVIEVPVKINQEIEAETTLVTLETDKATLEVPSAYSGKIKELTVRAGDKVSQGDIIGTISVSVAQSSQSSQSSEDTDTPTDTKTDTKQATELPKQRSEAVSGLASEKKLPDSAQSIKSNEPKITNSSTNNGYIPESPKSASSVHAGPGVRQFARALGIDLTQITGSGPKGRIVQSDLANFLKSQNFQSLNPIQPDIDFSKFGPIEKVARSRIQKLSASHLHRSWTQIPHVTQFESADITDLENFRKREQESSGAKLTILVFLMKAMIGVLKQFPNFNSSLGSDGQELILKRYYNMGVAVDTPNGLVVPVIRQVDQKSIASLAQELKKISAAARAGALKGSDLQGGTFTISSLGGIGGTYFTPIINAPEVAILGVSRLEKRVVEMTPGRFETRLFLPFSVSYDHRVVDGAEAARFVVCLKNYLEDIRQLILV